MCAISISIVIEGEPAATVRALRRIGGNSPAQAPRTAAAPETPAKAAATAALPAAAAEWDAGTAAALLQKCDQDAVRLLRKVLEADVAAGSKYHDLTRYFGSGEYYVRTQASKVTRAGNSVRQQCGLDLPKPLTVASGQYRIDPALAKALAALISRESPKGTTPDGRRLRWNMYAAGNPGAT